MSTQRRMSQALCPQLPWAWACEPEPLSMTASERRGSSHALVRAACSARAEAVRSACRRNPALVVRLSSSPVFKKAKTAAGGALGGARGGMKLCTSEASMRGEPKERAEPATQTATRGGRRLAGAGREVELDGKAGSAAEDVEVEEAEAGEAVKETEGAEEADGQSSGATGGSGGKGA